ncbi:hypothetical protein GOP47_0022992 [Adiantum capillus-veneris]|uniref:Uncharacterized protein n=1 Tax=Adiantum capillus-veneris TaxID=13818 RepID=A0A9D4Z4U2_ADICA|nr:hypothetical protein GOP47_0022992 [Adiantum capillus-veneris]
MQHVAKKPDPPKELALKGGPSLNTRYASCHLVTHLPSQIGGARGILLPISQKWGGGYSRLRLALSAQHPLKDPLPKPWGLAGCKLDNSLPPSQTLAYVIHNLVIRVRFDILKGYATHMMYLRNMLIQPNLASIIPPPLAHANNPTFLS